MRKRATAALTCALAVACSQTTDAEGPPPLVPLAKLAKPRKHRRWQTAIASYYDDAGAIACLRRASYGVAHRFLPCGTRVHLCVRRCVTATVDDRGPYVAGRDFDLTLTTAAAVGFPMSAGVTSIRWRLDGVRP